MADIAEKSEASYGANSAIGRAARKEGQNVGNAVAQDIDQSFN
jgi:hypothetical protein